MAMSVSVEQKISLPLLAVGTVMLVVTVAETYWYSATLQGVLVHQGLWKACGGNGNDVCVAFDGKPDWIVGPEVLECLSLTCAVGAIALSVRMLFHKTAVTCVANSALAIVAGILGISGAAWYNSKMDGVDSDWCFPVNLVADVMILVAGIILGADCYRTSARGGYQNI